MQDRIYLVPLSNPPPLRFRWYFADRPGSTLSGATPNLIAVADPISQTGCGSSVSGHGHGLASKAPAAGKQTMVGGNSLSSCPWSVSWQNTRQIRRTTTNTVFYDASGNVQSDLLALECLEIRNLPPAVITARRSTRSMSRCRIPAHGHGPHRMTSG